MDDLKMVTLAFIVAFFVGMILAPFVIKLGKRLKAEQSILKYVSQHDVKAGTPTFGGLIFLLAGIGVSLVFGSYRYTLSRMTLAVTLAYGVIGFIDDFLKVKRKDNQGLKAYQKIIFQLVVASVTAYFAYKNPYVGDAISLNFGLGEWRMGWLYIPFCIVTFLAMSNAVNLTDGLDGLAGTTTSVYIATFVVVTVLAYSESLTLGKTVYGLELRQMLLLSVAMLGGVVAFLWFNSHKAKIFMGDTGSLALGAFCSAQALFIKNPLLSILVGIMPVVSCISVIVQVLSFKTRGKRVFLMAPLHHHLELKGFKECKIVAYYGIVTLVAGVTALFII